MITVIKREENLMDTGRKERCAVCLKVTCVRVVRIAVPPD
jgi:hypothetical protein